MSSIKMLRVDLHSHSHFSDGTLSPTALVELAKQSEVDMLALTDHDSISGLNEAQTAADRHGIQLISGIEISTQWQASTKNQAVGIHVVGLDMQQLDSLTPFLLQQQKQRAERGIEICQILQQKTGLEVYPVALRLAGGRAEQVTRSHIAEAMIELKRFNRAQQVFDRYLKQGKPAFVALNWASIANAIDTIHAAKGVAVLAHPTQYHLSSTMLRRLVEDFKTLGGDGIELPANTQPASKREVIDRFAAQHQLSVSLSSDFHGANKPWIKLGHVPTIKPNQQGIWQKFSSYGGD